MSWSDWFSFTRPTLPVDVAERVSRWRAMPNANFDVPFRECRFVVLDTETSGLNVNRAELLSIGACVVRDGELQFNESFEVDLKPLTLSSAENVLVHEIGHQRQHVGVDPIAALAAFLEFAGKPIFVAHHALFDAAMIARALRRHLRISLELRWLDVGLLLAALRNERIDGPVELDALIERYGASCPVRHNALGDAYATAQLFLVALQQAEDRGLHTALDLFQKQTSAMTHSDARMSGA